MTNDEQEISIQEIIDIIKRQWRLIIIPAILASIVAAGISLSLPKEYESYSLLRIGYAGTKPYDSVASVKVIMNSSPFVEQIKQKSGLNDVDSLKYTETDTLLKVSARASDPEDAQKMVKTATELIIERHRRINEYSEQRLGRMVTYVKEILRPVPLSAGLDEFMVEPTRIEVPPLIMKEPIKVKVKLIVLLVFFGVLFVDILVAFYKEGVNDK
ncbi:MAG TPA: Wzz/FepE/Etk N-terminal domain-containing protein [Bacteroidales bacterium]|nr:Wzz/FepE/Etk N-terminal domain-containing protein [Bacteroidales bacterium]